MKRKFHIKQKKFFSAPSFFTKEIFIVAGLLFLAFILRLIYLSHLKVNDPYFYQPQEGTDMLMYHNSAHQILNLTFSKEPYYAGPFYSYFLALIYKIFEADPYIARLIQIIFGVATSLFIYLITRKVFNKTVALISISIFIFYGIFYVYEGILLMETLVTFLNTLSVFLLLRIEDKPSYKNIAFAGIPIGISALSRATILLFVPFILIWMLKIANRKSQIANLKKFGFLCLVILLTISPATIRNYLVSGRFVLISANGTVGLWLGNNPYSTAEYTYPPSSYMEEVAKKVEKEGEKVYLQEVIRFIKENPKKVVELYLERFLLFWSHEEVDNNINTLLQKGYSFIFRFPVILGFGFVAPLGLYGIILSLRRRKVLLLNLFIFAFMLSMMPFYILSRYRIAFVPILTVFAGFSIWWSYEKIKEKKASLFFSSLILLLFVSVFVHFQSIIGKFYPLFYRESIVSKKGDRIIIRDDSSRWQGGDFITLSPKSSCKKELLINEDVIGLKGYSLFFSYQAVKPGTLIFDINGTKGPVNLNSTDLMNVGSINLPPSIFHQGLNIITITSEDIMILIPIDSSYTFGRSYTLKDGQWEKLKKGEFMVWLEGCQNK